MGLVLPGEDPHVKLKIVSNGTGPGTFVTTEAGEIIQGIKELTYHVDATGFATLSLLILDVPIEGEVLGSQVSTTVQEIGDPWNTSAANPSRRPYPRIHENFDPALHDFQSPQEYWNAWSLRFGAWINSTGNRNLHDIKIFATNNPSDQAKGTCKCGVDLGTYKIEDIEHLTKSIEDHFGIPRTQIW